MITHYEVLGAKADASSREIKRAYKALAKCLHPDKNVGLNKMVQRLVEERFLEVQEAYETLSSYDKRKEYDEALAALHSEGEYYVPAPTPVPKQREPAKCAKCEKAGSPIHSICEDCRNEIAALQNEVKARRRLGVTACRLCGASKEPSKSPPLDSVCWACWRNVIKLMKAKKTACRLCGASKEPSKSPPLDSVCWTCWRNVIKLVKANQQVTICRLCGASKEPLKSPPLDSVCWACWRKVIEHVKANRQVTIVTEGAESGGMSKQLRSDRWVTAAVWLVIWLYLIVTHSAPFLAAVGLVIHCALIRDWGFLRANKQKGR